MLISNYQTIIPNNLYLRENQDGNYESIYFKKESFPIGEFSSIIKNKLLEIELKNKLGVKSLKISELERNLISLSEENFEKLLDTDFLNKLIFEYQREQFSNNLPSEEWILTRHAILPFSFFNEIEGANSEDTIQIYYDYIYGGRDENSGEILSEYKLFVYDNSILQIPDMSKEVYRKYNILQSDHFFVDVPYLNNLKEMYSQIFFVSDILKNQNLLSISFEHLHHLEAIVESFKYLLDDYDVEETYFN